MNSKRYWIETTPLTHDDAKKNCAAHDGWLADIASPIDPVNMELAEIRNLLEGQCYDMPTNSVSCVVADLVWGGTSPSPIWLTAAIYWYMLNFAEFLQKMH